MRTYTPDTSYSQYEYETNKEIQKLLSSQNTSPMKRKNSELAQKFMDIEQAKVALKNPLFGNRYIVFFSGAGSVQPGAEHGYPADGSRGCTAGEDRC